MARPSSPPRPILDNDPLPEISIDNVSGVEGDSRYSGPIFTFTVSLNPASAKTVTVDFATADGSATGGPGASPGVDYQTTSGTVTFVPSVTSQPVPVQVYGDFDCEGDENFFVNLTSPSNATISDPQGEGTILNDEVECGGDG